MTPRTAATSACVALALLLASGCSSKAADSGGNGGGGGSLKTDVGVTDKEITLLSLGDQSGVFKVIGLAYLAGEKVWVDEANAAGGICGRKIVLDVQDSGYKVDLAMPLYEQEKTKALGMIQLGGSPILAALKQKITADKMLASTASWASTNLDSPSVLMIGQTYDLEMLNGLAYLQKQGKIADGDKIGHIYVDSEYGQNALMGSQAYAKQHKMQIVGAAISGTDTDMTATITKMKAEGVKAIAMTTPPAALGSAALQNVAQGLNVPMMGSNPVFSPTLLQDPAVETALAQYYQVSSYIPIGADAPAAKKLLAKVQKVSSDQPNLGSVQGYTWGLAWGEILDQACKDGDMTRDGVLAAKDKITKVDTNGLIGALDFSKPGSPTSREGYIVQADKATPGGLKVVEDLFESAEAKAYKAPHQK
ncbi:ABC transporter substrate-binding protein [Cumulibacter manganitolerans]|uniref:ABC transporter substrate-binding protein n=1 Tax=Cumulibacter manganitolerans TaxID=1884992 RepID=UPI0012954801|nr:ABC transporter substrate-binding protein [Cumulibacter manganitolerans]